MIKNQINKFNFQKRILTCTFVVSTVQKIKRGLDANEANYTS